MIEAALVKAGGADYLHSCATGESDRVRSAFITLIGKTLPKDVNLNANGSLKLEMYLSTCPPPPKSDTGG